jgi:hypothetical protein
MEISFGDRFVARGKDHVSICVASESVREFPCCTISWKYTVVKRLMTGISGGSTGATQLRWLPEA